MSWRHLLLGVLLPGALCLGGCADPEAGLQEFEGIGGDFTLVDPSGQPYSLSSHGGEVRLLFFGFTNCPDVCPITLTKLQQVHRLLGDRGKKIRILFVSVDPERDTPERLAAYLANLRIPVTGLTGTVEEVARVAAQYGAFFEKVALDSAAVYTVDHSTRTYLIDGEGRVRYIFRYEDNPERIAHLVRKLLP